MQLLNSNFYVYRWTRLDNNTPFYVGKGKGNRFKDLKNGRNKYFLNIVNSIPCRVDIVLNKLTEQLAFDMEIKLIKIYKTYGYCEANFTVGGDGCSGYKHLPEAIEKTRLSNLGRKHTEEACKNYRLASMSRFRSEQELERVRQMGKSRKGHKDSEEIKLKKSLALKGKKKSEMHILNMSIAMKNRQVSAETGKKISEANKGSHHWYSKRVINVITGEIWGNAREAADANCLVYSTLRSKLNGRYKNNTNLQYVEAATASVVR